MIPQQILDAINRALSLESKSVLEYVLTSAWPSVIAEEDVKGMDTMKNVWARESDMVEALAEEFGASGGRIDLEGSWRFAPARFNFATSSYLLSVVPPLIRDELQELHDIRRLLIGVPRLAAIFDRILKVKSSGLETIEAAAKECLDAKAKAQASAGAKTTTAASAANAAQPWRNAKLSLADRLSAAANRTLFERVWAAMAQTDCTACGYDCEGYAKAIVDGQEKDLTKCVPGESETADALKKLMTK